MLCNHQWIAKNTIISRTSIEKQRSSLTLIDYIIIQYARSISSTRTRSQLPLMYTNEQWIWLKKPLVTYFSREYVQPYICMCKGLICFAHSLRRHPQQVQKKRSMFYLVLFLYSIWPSHTIASSLFRSAGSRGTFNGKNTPSPGFFTLERHSSSQEWLVESVQVIPLDDGQWKHENQYLSYMIYRENASSFILDLQLNARFSASIPIEYDQEEIDRGTGNCSFYGGSVRHWGRLKSMVSMSICSGLVSEVSLKVAWIITREILGGSHSSYAGWSRLFLGTQRRRRWTIAYSDIQSQLYLQYEWYLVLRSEFIEQPKSIRFKTILSYESFLYPFRRIDISVIDRRKRRSVIRERFIETLLVADASVTEFFAHPHVTELYLLTMMNMVNSIYGHVSLGYPVEIALTRIIMLSNQVKNGASPDDRIPCRSACSSPIFRWHRNRTRRYTISVLGKNNWKKGIKLIEPFTMMWQSFSPGKMIATKYFPGLFKIPADRTLVVFLGNLYVTKMLVAQRLVWLTWLACVWSTAVAISIKISV